MKLGNPAGEAAGFHSRVHPCVSTCLTNSEQWVGIVHYLFLHQFAPKALLFNACWVPTQHEFWAAATCSSVELLCDCCRYLLSSAGALSAALAQHSSALWWQGTSCSSLLVRGFLNKWQIGVEIANVTSGSGFPVSVKVEKRVIVLESSEGNTNKCYWEEDGSLDLEKCFRPTMSMSSPQGCCLLL